MGYFNTHATGSTNRNDRKTICVKEITWMQGPKTGCGAGYHQPATWEECQTLASAAYIHYWGGNGHSSHADPTGCIFRTPDQDIYFNTHATGSTSRNDRNTVCVKDMWVQGPKTGCEAGFHQPATWQECKAVATGADVQYWGGNGHSSNADPTGCIYRTPDQDIYFNTHATGSTNRNDRATVCVEDARRRLLKL